MPVYCVTVQVGADTVEEAVRLTIIPGCANTAEVEDVAFQTQYPAIVKVPPALILEDALPLED